MGAAYFDDIQLVRDAAPSYTYDKDGNLVTVAANAEQNAKMEYTNSNLTSRTDPKGNKYSYTYDSKHNMTQAKSQRGVEYNYTYDSHGNASQLVIQNGSGTEQLQSNTEYTSNGAFVSRMLDQNGYAASYSYNDATGVLNNATDAGGNTVSYTYDPKNDRIQSVSQTLGDGSKVSNSYGYTGENLTKITHNGFSYGFTYDSFGNVVKTSVGSQTLSTNTYGPNNGDLQKVAYGNGATVNYTYDNYGNTTSVAQNGTTNFKWSYNSTGYANQHVDLVNGLKYDYSYDTTGRLIRQNVRSNASNTNDNEKYRTEYQYDQNNNITKFTNQIAGRTHTEQFAFGKDNLPESYTMPNGVSKTYKFGPINRPYQTVINTKTPIQLETLYHLSKRNAENQSDYRTTQISQESLGNSQYRYSYDKLGNITQIQEKSAEGSFVTKCTYEYDGLNQLTRENNVYTGKTKVYTYDNGGNILKETEYPYTTGTVGSAIKTIPYTYSDTNWKDKLTSYNGETITYDAIGNPLSYRGYNLTWANGRQLSTLGGNGVTASYKYDANGLRTEKTVNGVKTVYYYVGEQLMYEKRGDLLELYYFYDEDAGLSGIRCITEASATDYVVVTNASDDVEALYDLNGALVAKYTYDAWGKQISVTDGSGLFITDQTHIGLVNPFRYRSNYLDVETGLYYLRARYFDTETHRFLNADGYVSTGQKFIGYNMFAYCNNNPVNRVDKNGKQSRYILDGKEYRYEGIADFHEMEHGRPPLKYQEALRQKQMKEQAKKQKKQSHHTNELRIDTDGATNGANKSTSHINETSYLGLAANKIPFIVVPMNLSSLLGHMGVVIDNNTGNFIYCIVGDTGKNENGMGEVSLKAAWDLGYPNADGSNGPEGDFTIIIYEDVKYSGSEVTWESVVRSGNGLYW